MFGTNKLKKQHLNSGTSYKVQSVFSTIQGEGPYAGRPAVFLRLAGCNLRCYFCDTDFESREREVVRADLVKEIRLAAQSGSKQKPTDLVVITGGEPFLQNLVPLCQELVDNTFDVQIETAGTLWNPGMDDLIVHEGVVLVCSPKAGKVHEKIAKYCQDWKYLIQEGCVDEQDGLPNKSTQIWGMDLMLARPPRRSDTIWLQPCEAYDVQYKTIQVTHGQKDHGDDERHSIEISDQRVTSSIRDEIQSRKNVELARDLAMKFNYRISLQIHKFLGIP